MEWLTEGQRVQKYRIEVWQGGQWKTVASSFAIGHKKIDHFDAVTAQHVRLNIVLSSGEARIRELQLFSLDGAAK
jgi:alpha-L-fucosidase